jgi:integrase
MTIVRVKGLNRYRSRHGKQYTYHRATGIRIEPPHVFGSSSFFEALAAAEAQVKAAPTPKAPVSGTFGALLRSYRESSRFQNLSERSKADYHKVFDWLQGLDSMPVREIDTAFIAGLRDKAFRQRKRRFANYMLAVVSVMFVHGIENKLARGNPARDVRKVRRPTHAPIANRAWTEAEKEAVLHAAPAHLIAPIAIARWTGIREGDIIRLGKTSYQDGTLNLTTAKRGVPHRVSCGPQLRAVLDAIPTHDGMRLCASSRGTPWTEDGFRASFFKLIRKLEAAGIVQPGLTFHGLRTSYAEAAADRGFNSREIAHALAQRDTKSADHYTRNVDQRRAAKAVSEALGGEAVVGEDRLSEKVRKLVYKPRKARGK